MSTIFLMPSEFTRGPLSNTALDNDGSKVPTYPAYPAQSVRLEAISDTASASLAATLLFFGSAGQVVGTATVQFTTPAAANFGTTYMGFAAIDPCWSLSGARQVGVMVTAITAGNWTINGVMA